MPKRIPQNELDAVQEVVARFPQGAAIEEISGALSEAAAQAEAERCMVCGHCGNCRSCLDLFGCPAFYVDAGRIEIAAALCTGCGVCADFCPNGAIVPLEAQ